MSRQGRVGESHLSLEQKPMNATLQVAAFSAAMEMVRSERPGGFANQLFSKLLRAALAPDAASGAVVGVLVNKYMAYADVRCICGCLWCLVSRCSFVRGLVSLFWSGSGSRPPCLCIMCAMHVACVSAESRKSLF